MTTRRRTVLRSAAAASCWAVAGCLTTGTGSTPDAGAPTRSSTAPTDSSGETASPTPAEEGQPPSTPVVTESSLSSGDGRCGNEPRVEVDRTEGGVRLEGDVIAPTPCHEAALEAAKIAEAQLRVRIGVRATGGMGCSQCLAAIPFQIAVGIRGTTPVTVLVELRGARPTSARFEIERATSSS